MSIEYKNPNNTLLTGGVTPDNKLWFYGSKWFDPTYENAMWFQNLTSQKSWFETHKISRFDSFNFTYAIKDEFSVDFRVPFSTEDLFDCAYVCRIKDYQGDYEKRFYYFIDSVDAYSPNSSVIHCTLDVIQTFMFKWRLGSQHILQCNGTQNTSLVDERWYSAESFMPEIEECADTKYLNPEIEDTGANRTGATGYAFSKSFLVVATEWHNGAGTWKSEKYNPNDVGDLIYITFHDFNSLKNYLWYYSDALKLNAIKGVYGIPFICSLGDKNQPVVVIHSTTPGREFDAYVVSSGVFKKTVTVTIPKTFYGYTPKNRKTIVSNVLSLESRSGKSALYKFIDLELTPVGSGDYILNLDICGILSIAPKVMVFPHTVPESSPQNIKSSNYLTFDISPSFSIFDTDGVEIYNNNFNMAIFKQTLAQISGAIGIAGGVASIIATGGATIPAVVGIAGGGITAVSSFASKSNMKANYQIPQNLIGSCESDDIWLMDMEYIVVRWLTPSEQNLKAYDDYLSTHGYNYSGKLVNLNGTGETGVSMFGRPCFCTITTDNCKLSDNNVGIYKTEIENIFNKGIRFWNPNNTYVSTGGMGNFTADVITNN